MTLTNFMLTIADLDEVQAKMDEKDARIHELEYTLFTSMIAIGSACELIGENVPGDTIASFLEPQYTKINELLEGVSVFRDVPAPTPGVDHEG